MPPVDLQTRMQWLLDRKDLKNSLRTEFNYKFLKNFDIQELKDYLETNINDEWYENNYTQQLYLTQKDTNSIMINYVANTTYRIEFPFEHEILCKDEKLVNLVLSMVQEICDIYGGKYGRVWLARLPAGKQIPLHVDHYDPFNDAPAADDMYSIAVHRIHICVTTNDDVYFTVNDEKKHMNPGECWELNHHLPHFVQNNGDRDRIHIDFDILPYKWL